MGVQLAGGPRSVVLGVRCTGIGVHGIKNPIFSPQFVYMQKILYFCNVLWKTNNSIV